MGTKRILALFLTLALCVSLCACGKESPIAGNWKGILDYSKILEVELSHEDVWEGIPIAGVQLEICFEFSKDGTFSTQITQESVDAMVETLLDIAVDGIKPIEVARYAEELGILGIGLYETDVDGYFVHVDTRTSKSFWYGQAQKYRSTFGGTRPTIMLGSKGEAVRELQIELTAMGLLNDVVDGKFGNKTRKAVIAFQEQRGLVKDGIVGKKTWAALYEFMAYEVEIATAGLNVRAGVGTKYAVNKVVKEGERFTITYEKDGWGWLSTGEGWISLKYTKKV